jgi:hypothetical protein
VPVHRQDLNFHTTLLCLSTARTWISTLNVCACPQPGPGFPHYMFVPVYSQDLDFYTTFVCLSTARTWVSTQHFCACPQPGHPGPGCGQAQKCSVEIQVLAVDRHKNVVWESRSWLKCVCLSTARTWISTLHLCACPQPGPGFPHYIFVPVHSQNLDFHATFWEIQVLAVDRHKNVVWKSRSWLWTGTKM